MEEGVTPATNAPAGIIQKVNRYVLSMTSHFHICHVPVCDSVGIEVRGLQQCRGSGWEL